jgi:glycosyltransferase involved in cell wall biosynthesis
MDQRILFLSWTVPPAVTGSAVVVENLAKQFTRDDMIVAGERPPMGPGMAWKEQWPEIVYVADGRPQTSRGARWWRKFQIPAIVFRCWRLATQRRCTAILVVSPSEEYLLAGYLVACWTGARLYPYFHNTYVEQCRAGSVAAWFARRLQARVFARASRVFVMSEGMVELYRQRYPGVACSALVHSFHEDLPEHGPPPAPGTPLRVALSGNVNASCVEATVRVCDAIARIDSTLDIVSGTARRYLQEHGLLQPHVRHHTVPREVMLRHLSESDILVLAHGFTGTLSPEEYATIFPTRTIEYLISGRPILAHAPAGCYLTRFLREHDCALVVDVPDVSAILDGIARLRRDSDLRARLVKNARAAAERFRGPRVAAVLRMMLHAADR